MRPSERDLLASGALLLFVSPWVVALVGWLAFMLFAGEGSTAAIALTSLIVGAFALVPALVGMIRVATARRRAQARAVRIDVDEMIITFPGRAPDVWRLPDRVVVRGSGITWRLETEHEGERSTLLRGVPHGSGADLARAASALAEHLDVEARIPAAARRARGFVPNDTDVWAAICYAPLDGVNVAYSLFALMTSPEPRLRFAAKQSLVLLAVEGILLFFVFSCVGLPLVFTSLPIPLELAVFVLPLLVLGGVRGGLRFLLSYRAYRGRAWVIPFLAPLSRRWLPPSDGTAAPASKKALENHEPRVPAEKMSGAANPLPRPADDTPIGDPFSGERGR